MSEQSEGILDKKFSRRGFLKLSALFGTAAVLAGCGSANEKESELEFPPVEKGDVLQLEVSAKGKEKVSVNYVNDDVERMKLRTKNGTVEKLDFSPGAETVRHMGEITSDKLQKVTGTNTGPLYINLETSGNRNDNFGRRKFELAGNYYALPVITYNIDFMGTGAPSEKNKNYVSESSLSKPSEFGHGFAVGKLNSVGDRDVFAVEGYICDARALILE